MVTSMSPQHTITLDHNPSVLQRYKVLHPQNTKNEAQTSKNYHQNRMAGKP